jgi:hypothetical protein
MRELFGQDKQKIASDVVRMRSLFRQDKQKIAFDSPNEGLIRTG